jgi:hypothetical protein
MFIRRDSMKILKALFAAYMVCLSPTLEAQWYNPFSKKTAEDCILEKIKETRGEDAVRALQMSCYAKYESVNSQSPSSTNADKDKERRLKSCKIEPDDYKFIELFDVLGTKSREVSKIIDNVKKANYDRASNSISFQNNNSFGISTLMIGFTKGKVCSTSKSDYDYTTYCGGSNSKSGVSTVSFGRLSCGTLPSEVSKLGMCVLGFSPTYDRFDGGDSMLAFKEKNGFCQ